MQDAIFFLTELTSFNLANTIPTNQADAFIHRPMRLPVLQEKRIYKCEVAQYYQRFTKVSQVRLAKSEKHLPRNPVFNQMNSLKDVNVRCLGDNDAILESSKLESSEADSIKQKHYGIVHELLTSNGLVRVPVVADGNCFFAAATHLPTVTDGQHLHRILCDHLENPFR